MVSLVPRARSWELHSGPSVIPGHVSRNYPTPQKVSAARLPAVGASNSYQPHSLASQTGELQSSLSVEYLSRDFFSCSKECLTCDLAFGIGDELIAGAA